MLRQQSSKCVAKFRAKIMHYFNKIECYINVEKKYARTLLRSSVEVNYVTPKQVANHDVPNSGINIFLKLMFYARISALVLRCGMS